MGFTKLAKFVLIPYGLIGLVALTSKVSGGETGEQIFIFAVLIIFLSFGILGGINLLWIRGLKKDPSIWILWQNNQSDELHEKKFNYNKKKTATNQNTHQDSQKLNYYQILGVPKNATTNEIKKGFRKQIMYFHADKNKTIEDPDEYSKDLYEARDSLLDPEKRRKYDASIT